MKKAILSILVILLLAACSSDPTPTPRPSATVPPTKAPSTKAPATETALEEIPTDVPPTEIPPTTAPTEAATVETAATSPIDTMTHTPDPLLTNITWEWVRRDPNGNQMDEIIVPNPENYTLFFNEDGTFNAQLDCNSSNGRYATDNPGSIFMELGATTLAFCGETSLDGQMVMMFGPAQSYRFEENGSILVFAWVAGGPIDYFRNADAPAAVDTNLVGKTWQWHGLTSSVLDMTVKTPANYTILFNEDGRANIQADCNLVQASYTAAGGSITIQMGPTTLALCPDGSLSDLFLLGLETTTSYTIPEDTLALSVGQNDGVMLFTEAGTEVAEPDEDSTESEVTQPAPDTDGAVGIVNAPDGINMRTGPGTEYSVISIIPDGETLTIVGVSQDKEWWVIENPEGPDEQGWVSGNFVQATNTSNVPVVAAPEIEPTLTDNPWQWLSLTTPVETTTVSDPSLYTIQFNTDGSAAIRADCNTATASYTTNENAISISLGATTLVACPDGSLDALYLNTMTNVTTYFFEAGDLYLEMPADGGTMRFAADKPPQPETPEEPEATPEPPPAEAEGDHFQVVSFGAAGSEQDVLADTTITIIFTETEVKGNAGCNDYSGTLNRTDDAFTISNIVATQTACAEPAGIMEQEQAYLTALENIGGFTWEEKLSADGSKFVTVGQLFYVVNSVNGIINLITP